MFILYRYFHCHSLSVSACAFVFIINPDLPRCYYQSWFVSRCYHYQSWSMSILSGCYHCPDVITISHDLCLFCPGVVVIISNDLCLSCPGVFIVTHDLSVSWPCVFIVIHDLCLSCPDAVTVINDLCLSCLVIILSHDLCLFCPGTVVSLLESYLV